MVKVVMDESITKVCQTIHLSSFIYSISQFLIQFSSVSYQVPHLFMMESIEQENRKNIKLIKWKYQAQIESHKSSF